MTTMRVARPLLRSCGQPIGQLRTFVTSSSLRSSTILPRLNADLKDAMRAKDKPKLNVLRAVLAEIKNASFTPKPVDSDSKLLALLKKQMASCEKAIEEFENAKREDLVEKERTQVNIMQAYVNEIPVLEATEVDSLVEEVMAELQKEGGKAQFGPLMKGVLAKIAGRPVDQTYVTEKIKSVAA